MNLFEEYIDYIREHSLWQRDDHLLLTVSGGIDSVTLAHLTHQAGYSFSIAHCNFNLRGEESRRDESFVAALAKKLRVNFYCKNFDTKAFAKENKVSAQEAARELRYRWFHAIIEGKEKPAVVESKNSIPAFIVTAHNQDDNVETVLMNFCKGTGVRGLKGIEPNTGRLRRPLLFAGRKRIEGFAEENHIQWVEDSSNTEEKYTRNYFRHTVIPAIEKIFPDLKEQITDNIQRFQDTSDLYNQAIVLHKKKLCTTSNNEVHIPVLKLLKTTPLRSVIFEIIREYGFQSNQVSEVVKLCEATNGSYISSPTHRIIRNRKWLIIAPLQQQEASLFIIEKPGETVHANAHSLTIRAVNEKEVSYDAEDKVFISGDELEFPLILRKWKQGDYFYPLGMSKKKKLARFFIDQKLSATEKEDMWVIESDKKIVWVAGRRIDDRFRLRPSTRTIICLTWS